MLWFSHGVSQKLAQVKSMTSTRPSKRPANLVQAPYKPDPVPILGCAMQPTQIGYMGTMHGKYRSSQGYSFSLLGSLVEGPISVRNSPSAMARSIGASARVANTFSADSSSTTGGAIGLSSKPVRDRLERLVAYKCVHRRLHQNKIFRSLTKRSVKAFCHSVFGSRRPAATIKS
jgi:hypothetical protein